ncbi:ABC transporter permease [Cereibacter sphaeroides]|uniref:ABC transporter permease n=1 Tax=Cereibacter sphaeroides TaxID=1063 RepID=UPI000191CBA8|nr:ABC transporter permease [Cereibacter sphaeroides]ACM04257.1 ABC-type transporter, permease component: PepT family [Cereibacter sphaeroides KD131]
MTGFLKEFAESRMAAACLALSLLFAACALFAPLIAPMNPYDLRAFSLDDARLPPGSRQVEKGGLFRATLSAREGTAEESEGAATFRLVEEAPGRLLLTVETEGTLGALRILGLPRDASVEGARRHPIRSEWTLADPTAPAAIETGAMTPAVLNLTVEAELPATATDTRFALGTDSYGRDMLSAIIYGIRISFIVGAIGAVGSMAVGSALGLAAAWFGGRVDAAIMRLADFQLSIPSLMVGLLTLTILGKGVDKILIAIILIQWTVFARTTRSVALAELRSDYVDAARGLRLSAVRINLRHILPNCLPPLLVILTINIASAITLEASLSFLGVGLPLTQPSLGMLIANGYEYMFSNLYWIAIFPGIALMLMVVSINVVGDRLRDMFNPQLKR